MPNITSLKTTTKKNGCDAKKCLMCEHADCANYPKKTSIHGRYILRDTFLLWPINVLVIFYFNN